MKRYVFGLNQATATPTDGLPDGALLVRVERAQHRWHGQKRFYALVFSVLEPKSLAGTRFSSRLYCTPKDLWKLNWFLHDFGYDTELLGRDEIDDKQLIGLSGVVKVTHSIVNGTSLLKLDGFAPRRQWKELYAEHENRSRERKAAS
jgi:hypothetical protein